jgi:multiple sugar transport system substrate-binding protein
MKHMLRFLTVLSVLIVLSALLGGCTGAATPAAEKPAEEKPAATEEAKAEAPAATEEAKAEAPAATEAPATEEATEEAPAATEEPAAAEGEEVALRWRTRPDNQAEIDVYQSISDELDKALDGISLKYEAGGSETSSYQDVLKTEIAAGTAPDVFWIPGTDVADFATRGLIMDLREMAAGTDGYSDENFYPGPMFHLTFNPESGKSGETLWGLPRDVSTFALYLNLDLINEAGAPDPRELAKEGKWNWDSFVEVSQAVRGLGTDIYGYGANAWWGPYGVWLNAAGGGFFNEDRSACGLDSEGSIAGLEFERKLYQDLDVAVPYGEDSEPPFLAGKVGMFQNGRWATPSVRSSAKFNWDVVELPEGPAKKPGNWLFWGAYVVNAKTAHPAEAWALVQSLTTAETQGKVSALGANIPSRVSQEALDAFLTFTPPDNNQAFLNGLAQEPATEGPVWAGSWPEYDAIMGPAVQAVLTGNQSIDDFKANICNEANKVFN